MRTLKRPSRVALIAGAAILVAALAWTAWIGVRGWMAKDELDSARALTDELRTAVESGDLASASATTERMLVHADAAAALTSDPLWRAAEAVPVAGANLEAARVVSAGLADVLSDAALPMMQSAQVLVDELRLAEGGIDTALLASQQPVFEGAAATLVAAAADLGGIDPDELIPQVGDGVRQLDAAVTDLVPIVGALDHTASVLPATLGADGPRTILVMLQNNAELRTSGGISGSFVELRAESGRLTLVSQADSSEFDRAAKPVLPIPAETLALYGDQVGRFVQNATMPADFDLSARLASNWWERRTGTAPDTVLSVDPLVLRSMLTVTGPIATDHGTLTAEDLVQQLLVAPYMSLDSDAQTEVFRTTASAVFTAVADFDFDPVAFATALAEPIGEGRISVWSAHPDEQDVLAQTSLAGPAARQRNAGPDAFAVYLNDATGGKMDSFLDLSIASGSASCRPDGRQDVVVSVTLTSTVEPSSVWKLPQAMTGGGHYGARIGDIATNVSVSAPAGSFFGGVSVDGRPLVSVDVEEEGLSVSATRVDLGPGESQTVDFRFIAAGTDPVDPQIMHTPLIGDMTVTEAPAECG